MKKVLVLLLLVAGAFSSLLAQEEPIPPKRSKAPKFGAFGGLTGGWLSVDVGPINNFLAAGKGASLSKNGVFLIGGGGAAYIMVVPNLRVGYTGMGGSIKSTSLDGVGVRRDAELSAGFWGITVEYVYTLVDRLDVTGGILLGKGGIDITLNQSNGGSNTWLSEQTYFGSGLTNPPNNVTRRLTSSFFTWVPEVNLEYAVMGWLGVRAGVSYVGMSAPSWQVDGTYDLLGVPSNVTGKGFMVNFGVFVGTYYSRGMNCRKRGRPLTRRTGHFYFSSGN